VSPLNPEGININQKENLDGVLLYRLEKRLHNIYFGISWLKTIGKNKQ